MSSNPFARLRLDLEKATSARRAETYDMINIRPGTKIAAMVEVLAELRGIPVASMLTEELSERLALYAASDHRHTSAILDAAEAFIAEHGTPSPESALGRLMKQGLLKVETDNPLIRAMKNHPPPFSIKNGKASDSKGEGE